MLTPKEWATAREETECVFIAVIAALDDRLLDLNSRGELCENTARDIVNTVYGPLFKTYRMYVEWYEVYESHRTKNEGNGENG